MRPFSFDFLQLLHHAITAPRLHFYRFAATAACPPAAVRLRCRARQREPASPPAVAGHRGPCSNVSSPVATLGSRGPHRRETARSVAGGGGGGRTQPRSDGEEKRAAGAAGGSATMMTVRATRASSSSTRRWRAAVLLRRCNLLLPCGPARATPERSSPGPNAPPSSSALALLLCVCGAQPNLIMRVFSL